MTKNMSFEKAAARLTEIVELLESGGQTLEQSLKLFEEGSTLSKLCYGKLASAEQKVRQITELEDKEENGPDCT